MSVTARFFSAKPFSLNRSSAARAASSTTFCKRADAAGSTGLGLSCAAAGENAAQSKRPSTNAVQVLLFIKPSSLLDDWYTPACSKTHAGLERRTRANGRDERSRAGQG